MPLRAQRARMRKHWGAGLCVLGAVRPHDAFAMLAKGFSSARLETRTKESNMYASIWVTKPWCAMKVKGGLVPPEVGPAPPGAAHHRPIVRLRKI